MKHWEPKEFKDGKSITTYSQPDSVWQGSRLTIINETSHSFSEIIVKLGENETLYRTKKQTIAMFREAIKWIEGLK